MRISVCVGNYAVTPYCIPGLEINVYCMEELCYCMKENAFLLDFTLMNDELLGWIEQECGLRELAKALYTLVHKKGSLSAFVVTILRFVGFYDDKIIEEAAQALKRGAGLSNIEKRKSQIDRLVKQKRYIAAMHSYDRLIGKWREQEKEGEPLPAVGCLAAILHNKGVALAGMMLYQGAAECFLEAYETENRPEYYRDYLAAKRMELSEGEYVSLIAGNAEGYEGTLELEREIERLTREWEQQPEFLRQNSRRELRDGPERQKILDEYESVTQALKESYRESVKD